MSIHGKRKNYDWTQGIRSRPRSRHSKDQSNLQTFSPTNIKGIRSVLGYVSFYRRFIKDFSKIIRPLTKFLEKDTTFEFNEECHNAFKLLKEKLTCALVNVSPNWNRPFELMCDASDFAVGAILVLSKTIVHTDHSALMHLFKKQNAKPRLIRWILLLQEFDIEIKDRKSTENVTADHLSQIENDKTSDNSEVDDNFSREALMEINTRNEPWFVDFVIYLVSDIIPKGMMYQQKNKFFSDLKHNFWEESYLFKAIIKESHTQLRLCEACQKKGNISKRDEMPSNSIQYVRDNDVPVVHSGASSVLTDAFMMIYDDMCEPHDQPVLAPSQNTVVKNSLTAELAIYKEHVELPIKAFTVYPPNTPAALVPKVLPTKRQVKILIFTLIQLFSEFDQTCKKRITPSAITDGVRGFEQTKACYLQEDVFEELEAEVAQHAVVRKHDAIELKNLLIANDNLIAECLSQEVFCVATNFELNVARFTDMHVANPTAETRCLALEDELAILREINNQDNQTELINHFSKLEVSYLNLQLKYQDLKDQIRNSPPTPDKDTPDFDSVFVIGKMQASLQGKDNVIRQFKKELSQLQVTHQDTDHTLCVQTTDSQITKLTDQVTHLQEQNDLFRTENDKIKQHYKELYDSIKITRAKHIEQVTKLTTKNMNLKTGVNKATANPLVSARDKHAIDVEPIVPRLRNNRNAHLDYLRNLKESVETIRDIVEEAKVVRPLDRSIVSACRYTKHSQELLEYAIGTCPHGSQPCAKQLAYIPLIKKKQVIVAQPSNKVDSTTHPHVVTVTSQKINVPVPPSKGVDCCPIAHRSQPMSHVKPNRISPAKGDTKPPIDDKPKKISLTFEHRLSNHDLCVATCLQSAMDTPSIHYNRSVERKVKQVWKPKHVRQVWKPTGIVLTTIGHQWRPTDKMADVNAPSDQTPTMAPPVRVDDQIIPHIRWIPIGKSNCYLDLEKSQSNPIYKIAVDLLKNTNFFRAFTASSDLPSIYIQQFWDTIIYDKKAGCYKCQLDEQWFDLT
nr:hypothetical protein [Tanacetum cinerariifolium]